MTARSRPDPYSTGSADSHSFNSFENRNRSTITPIAAHRYELEITAVDYAVLIQIAGRAARRPLGRLANLTPNQVRIATVHKTVTIDSTW